MATTLGRAGTQVSRRRADTRVGQRWQRREIPAAALAPRAAPCQDGGTAVRRHAASPPSRL